MNVTAPGFSPLIPDASALKPGGARPATPGPDKADAGFADRLGDAVQSLAESQTRAAEAATAFELGERQDLAGVMVEQQVASLGFQLALNVRNRALTAYRDIMNMSV